MYEIHGNKNSKAVTELMTKKNSKRDEVLDTAEALFERQGFIATGINQITREAGVAPMTLYNNFTNKDDLILATLERRSDRLISVMADNVQAAGDDPKERILAMFDGIDRWIQSELKFKNGFAGCSFIRASLEFGDSEHPAHIVSANHKRKIIQLFEDNLRAGNYPDAEKLSLSLQLIMDGAIVQAHVLGDKDSARRAKAMVETLLNISR